MERYRRLTLLHSNDIHGDVLAESDGSLVHGGLPLLSGYVDRVRQEEENVLYVLAGDMVSGTVIDSDYRGLSTMELLNMLSPDAAVIGNHEADYTLAHLLLLERCADFPFICANLYLTPVGRRLFRPYIVAEVGGMRVLFIGLLTEELLAKTRLEDLVGPLLTVHDPAEEVGTVCTACRSQRYDLTVLLTHIGLEADKRLAASLDPRWGVDLIIGGHSHTLMSEPVTVNGIPIVQAGWGSDQIGRFDIVVDTQENCLQRFTWSAVPVTPQTCTPNPAMQQRVSWFREQTEKKYARVITHFAGVYTHPDRMHQTELGGIFADAFLSCCAGTDIVLIASGAIRSEKMGPEVTLGSLSACYPFGEEMWQFSATGAQLRRMFAYMLRDEAFAPGAHSEYYQFPAGLFVRYSRSQHAVTALTLHGEAVADDRVLTVAVERYHYLNLQGSFGIAHDELTAGPAPHAVLGNPFDALTEVLSAQPLITADPAPRLEIED